MLKDFSMQLFVLRDCYSAKRKEPGISQLKEWYSLSQMPLLLQKYTISNQYFF